MLKKSHMKTLALAAGALALAGGTLLPSSQAEAKDNGRVCIAMTKMYPPQCLKWKPAPKPPKPPKKDKHHDKKEHKEQPKKDQKERRQS